MLPKYNQLMDHYMIKVCIDFLKVTIFLVSYVFLAKDIHDPHGFFFTDIIFPPSFETKYYYEIVTILLTFILIIIILFFSYFQL